MGRNDLITYGHFGPKESTLRTASWFLTLLLAGLLVYSVAQVPGKDSVLSLHVASRYQQSARAETGIPSQTGAILADYRSLDLLAVSILLGVSTLTLLFFFNQPPNPRSLRLAFPLLAFGIFMVLGCGFLCLKKGNNFLDYETFAYWFASPKARLDGALLLSTGTLLVLAGFLALWRTWLRSPEGSNGR